MARVLRIEPLDATFGALVTGVRLADIDEGTWAQLHAAWLEHALLVFPGQHLSHADQLAFARRFGEIEQLGGRDLVPVGNVKPDGTLRDKTDETDGAVKILQGNMGWHCDSTYMPVQAKGAVFTAEVVPSSGGETGWADMRAAYDALDNAMRARVGRLSAYHSLRYSQAKVGHVPAEGDSYSGYGFDVDDPPLRPLVKVHPETGRRSLVIGRHAYGVTGMDPATSERFLTELVEQACQPPRVYHHRWSPGDAVLWDNRCLLHRSRPWDMSERRIMWHSRIAGDASELAAPYAGARPATGDDAL
jgi:alpha-ketoglutarate-dependent taurine dioxygenase